MWSSRRLPIAQTVFATAISPEIAPAIPSCPPLAAEEGSGFHHLPQYRQTEAATDISSNWRWCPLPNTPSFHLRRSELKALAGQDAQIIMTAISRRFCSSGVSPLCHDPAPENNEDIDDKEAALLEETNEQDLSISPGPADSKDAGIIESMCRLLERQLWEPSTEACLQQFVKDLSPHVISMVIQRQERLAMAKQFFEWASKQREPTPYSYHALLLKVGEAKKFAEMWDLLDKMRRRGCQVTATSLSIIIKAYGVAGLPKRALEVIERAHEFNVPLDVPVYTTLLGVLFPAKLVQQAKSIYKRMLAEGCTLDSSAWSTVIRGFGKNGLTKEAEKCFDQMLLEGCKHNIVPYNSLIEGFCECKALNKAILTLAALQERGYKPNTYTYNPIIGALCEAGRFTEAMNLFSSMISICRPNQATFNILLQGLLLNKDNSQAVEFFEMMRGEGWVDVRSYVIVANGLRKAKQIDKLRQLSKELHAQHGSVNISICNALLQCLCDSPDSYEAENFFSEMANGLSNLDVTSYATMINGRSRSGKVDEARTLLSEMQDKGCRPNSFCYTPLIGAMLKVDRVVDATRLFQEMLERDLETNEITCDFLLRKLSESGIIDDVLRLCNHIMGKRFCIHNITLFSLMKCFSKLGRVEEANALLRAMNKQGCLVDSRPVKQALKVLDITSPLDKDDRVINNNFLSDSEVFPLLPPLESMSH